MMDVIAIIMVDGDARWWWDMNDDDDDDDDDNDGWWWMIMDDLFLWLSHEFLLGSW